MRRWTPPWQPGLDLVHCVPCGDLVVAVTLRAGACAHCRHLRRGPEEIDELREALTRRKPLVFEDPPPRRSEQLELGAIA